MLKPNLYTTFQTFSKSDVEHLMGYAMGKKASRLAFDLGLGMPYWVPSAYRLADTLSKERVEVLASQYLDQNSKDYEYLCYALWGLSFLNSVGDTVDTLFDIGLYNWLNHFKTDLNGLRVMTSNKVRNLWAGINPVKLLGRLVVATDLTAECTLKAITLETALQTRKLREWKQSLFERATSEANRYKEQITEMATELRGMFNIKHEEFLALCYTSKEMVLHPLMLYTEMAQKVKTTVNQLVLAPNKQLCQKYQQFVDKYREDFGTFMDGLFNPKVLRLGLR